MNLEKSFDPKKVRQTPKSLKSHIEWWPLRDLNRLQLPVANSCLTSRNHAAFKIIAHSYRAALKANLSQRQTSKTIGSVRKRSDLSSPNGYFLNQKFEEFCRSIRPLESVGVYVRNGDEALLKGLIGRHF